MSGYLIGPSGVASLGGGTLSFAWQSSTFVGSTPAPNASMFTNQAIGTASSDRFVVVAIAWLGTGAAGMDIPSNGVTIGGVTATQAVYSRPSSRGHAVYYANISTGTTATIGITGYTNGFIDEIVINTAIITGSATTSSPSNDVTPAYANGLTTSPALTVPVRGVSIISAVSVNNGSTSAPSTWTGATLDNDQYDTNTLGITGSMAHLTVSATVTENSVNGGGPTGWVVAAFQP